MNDSSISAAELRERIVLLIGDYLKRPDVQKDTLAVEVLNCLAGDLQVMELPRAGPDPLSPCPSTPPVG